MDEYTEVTIIVDGALTGSESFDDAVEAEDFALAAVDTIHVSAPESFVEAYLMTHGHGMRQEDCECAQYLTDHRPYTTRGAYR